MRLRRGDPQNKVAKRFCVSVAWVYRLAGAAARYRLDRSCQAARRRPAACFRGASPLSGSGKAVEECPDATLEELREATGVTCGTSAVFRALNRLGLPRKKVRAGC